MSATSSDKAACGTDAAGLVSHWIRPEIRSLSAYHVPDRTNLVLLDAMENPHPWPGPLAQQWLQRLSRAEINRYPDPQAHALKTRLRAVAGVPDGAELLFGNGSDEIIQLICMAVSAAGRVVMAPEPGFVMYRMTATACGLGFVGVNLRGDFSLDMPAMREAIARHQPAVLFLAYPNNPTGNCWSDADIGELIRLAPGLVVVDEAYEPFARRTFLSRVGQYPNLVVMRTLSKLGLAGLRLGYLCGAPEWLTELDKLRLPYNINTLTQLSAEFALEHVDVLQAQADGIRALRATLIDRLNAMPGFTAYPSDANFVLFRTPPGRAGALHAGLLKRGVLIKNLSRPGLLADCLRVTVGSAQEQTRFLEALETAHKD